MKRQRRRWWQIAVGFVSLVVVFAVVDAVWLQPRSSFGYSLIYSALFVGFIGSTNEVIGFVWRAWRRRRPASDEEGPGPSRPEQLVGPMTRL